MAAHRYWRAVTLDTLARGVLTITSFQLFDAGGRVDDDATISTGVPTSAGVIANLQDASFATSATWTQAAYKSPGMHILWDFASGDVDVTSITVAGASAATFPFSMQIESSDDGETWALEEDVVGLDFLGAGSPSSVGLRTNTFYTLGTYRTKLTSDRRTAHFDAADNDQRSRRSIGHGAGKHYWEMVVTEAQAGNTMAVGVTDDTQFAFGTGLTKYILIYNAALIQTSSGISIGSGFSAVSYTTGDVIRFALDADANELYVGKNGTWLGGSDPVTSTNPCLYNLDAITWFGIAVGNNSGLRRSVSLAETAAFTVPAGYTFDGADTGDRVPVPNVVTHEVQGVVYRNETHADPAAKIAVIPSIAKDAEFGGRGVISGNVKYDADPTDLPLRRKVRLQREKDGRTIREVFSDKVTGNYEFTNIDEREKYTVISYDYEHNYRAVIADSITPGVPT